MSRVDDTLQEYSEALKAEDLERAEKAQREAYDAARDEKNK